MTSSSSKPPTSGQGVSEKWLSLFGILVVGVILWGVAWSAGWLSVGTPAETLANRTIAYSASHDWPYPSMAHPQQLPRITSIPIPESPGGLAIWGSTGRDNQGHIWFGVSTEAESMSSARLFEYRPNDGAVILRGDVVSELKRSGVHRDGETQQKIHSKIFQAEDGLLYFASMDEQGEHVDGTQLPTWGSHLWRISTDTGEWQHLRHVPEALIALGHGGRHVYALGYFGHVLYQYNIDTGELKSTKVGSVGGHVSRNLIVDHRGHAYVPRVSRVSTGSADSEEPSALQAELVELDVTLREVSKTPLHEYGADAGPDSHGVTAYAVLKDKSIVFVTQLGYAYRIHVEEDGPARVDEVGWLHPEGTAYTASLISIDGERYLAGAAARNKKPLEWVVFDLASQASTAQRISFPHSPPVVYGSDTRDDRAGIYLVGSHTTTEGSHRPALYRLDWEERYVPPPNVMASPKTSGGPSAPTAPDSPGTPIQETPAASVDDSESIELLGGSWEQWSAASPEERLAMGRATVELLHPRIAKEQQQRLAQGYVQRLDAFFGETSNQRFRIADVLPLLHAEVRTEP